MRIPFGELLETLKIILLHRGFDSQRADLCARLFAEATCDGVYSHGLNRFPRFLRMIDNGSIDIHLGPTLTSEFGSLERLDGNRGPGNLNAYHCMGRAISLANKNGISCVALANTNHWMRGGSYGWQAAEAGMIGICWTNTLPNLPAWGSEKAVLGNNPLVIAVPRANGHVVLDMAMSQFSFGSLEAYRDRGEVLPVAGGYDASGKLSRDAAAIEETGRVIPIGYWKGSGLSLVLDMIAAILAAGKASHQIPNDPEFETGLSQTFIAIKPAGGHKTGFSEMADQIIQNLRSRSESGAEIRYPGERTLRTREDNLEKGIPVDAEIWNYLTALA